MESLVEPLHCCVYLCKDLTVTSVNDNYQFRKSNLLRNIFIMHEEAQKSITQSGRQFL